MNARIILFCYAFIAGLVAAMLWPSDPGRLPLFAVLTGLAFAASVAGFLARRARLARMPEAGAPSSAELTGILAVLLAVPAVLLGYTRHLAANSRPDRGVAVVRLADGRAEWQAVGRGLPETARLCLRKTAPSTEDVELVLHGRLDAFLPEPGPGGQATLDERGRWRMRVVSVAQTSEPIRIRRDDPPGMEYVVAQPFTAVDRVEVRKGAGSAEFAVDQLSNHLSAFVREGRAVPDVTLLGRITSDPLIYDFKTVLPVTPDFIQLSEGGPFLRVEGGDVQVAIRPDMAGYESFARSAAYGWDVEVRGRMTAARPATNPGGYDARRYFANYNVFGLVSVYAARGEPPPVRAVLPAGARAPRTGNAMVEFSLDLRDRLLRILKQTMPDPQSAFLGGVTLGLRYGMQNTRFDWQRLWAAAPAGEGRSAAATDDDQPEAATAADTGAAAGFESLVNDEFKAAGVNHVMAVSGLHVTIITVLFIGLFTLMRIPRRASTPVIVIILVVFAIITGARPSTLRAVIMNSFFLLTWTYLGERLRSSVLLSCPVAAFLILLENPLILVDPSFTLSFGAILSLALFTGPFYDWVSGFHGWRFIALLMLIATATGISIFACPLFTSPLFLALFAAYVAGLFWLARRLERRQSRPWTFGLANLPPGAGQFLAAQLGIQIGMMMPLSAYYFCRWSFGGAFANLIAIPLIGVVLQMSMLACMIGFLPGIGVWLALLINAANWIFTSFFMILAHAVAITFPYVFVRRPMQRELVVYYLLLAVWLWHRPLRALLERLCRRLRLMQPRAPAVAFGLVLVAFTLPLWVGRPPVSPPGVAQMTVLSAGYGSAIVVETPGGKHLLLDTGYVQHEMGMRNEAIRTVLPYLYHRRILALDAVILTNPRPERTAGMANILQYIRAPRVIVPAGSCLSRLQPGDSVERCNALLGPADIPGAPDAETRAAIHRELAGPPEEPGHPSFVREMARRAPTWVNRLAAWSSRIEEARAGDVLFREQGPGGEFRIEVLNPGPAPATEFPLENSSLALRIVYGKTAFLLPSDLHAEGQRRLAALPSDRVRADVLLMPQHGAAWPAAGAGTSASVPAALDALLDKVGARWAIYEYGNPRGVLGNAYYDARMAFEKTRRQVQLRPNPPVQLVTDDVGAVIVQSDGRTCRVRSQIGGPAEAAPR